jgi:hypothetical protein
VSQEYYILLPDGTRTGPCAEEEVLDLLESGDLDPAEPCLNAETGRVCPAGEMFHVIAPEPEAPPEPQAPVAWQPAPFPDEKEKPAARPRPRLLYRGCPSALNYWRSTVLAGVVIAGGYLLRTELPALLALTQIAGSLILLSAILRLLRTQYWITSVRVEVHTGLLARSTRELRIADIRAIHVERRGLISGLLGIGTVTFSSTAGLQDDVVFRQVWRASALKQLVRRIQDSPPPV